ncbi:uncharacterized protein LOC132262709 isoform X2 [Phlebotomus argentipes]|uniref:uncharacterized protein LOC132262709 isoform X2 n=1 Tax=Phlebotomus argentipes TaxID=94469 RepID=UPI0028934297|nr:uncharacterized protein LOC132262709 isoform X2 [Phlebotomus argentipes]
MAAVIRVKRRIDEEPLNAFVLNCKRRKVSPENAREAVASSSKSNDVGLLSSGEEKSTILKFAGTVESQDESHITKMTKEEAKELMGKTRIPQPVARARDSHRLKTQEERFRIVNCSRAVDSSGSGEEKPITILDIEKQSTLPAAEETAQSPSRQAEPENRQGFRLDFVYDLYVSELGDLETDIDDGMLENQLSKSVGLNLHGVFSPDRLAFVPLTASRTEVASTTASRVATVTTRSPAMTPTMRITGETTIRTQIQTTTPALMSATCGEL